jgi:hypothetical protein
MRKFANEKVNTAPPLLKGHAGPHPDERSGILPIRDRLASLRLGRDEGGGLFAVDVRYSPST